MKHIFPIFILIALCGCIDPLNTDLPEQESKLVVFAEITNDTVPYTVQLGRSTPYTALRTPKETNAKVYVTDSTGNRYEFYEIDMGIYQSTPSEFIGKVGMKYQLTVVTSDDKRYISDFSPILPTGEITSLNFKKDSRLIQVDNNTIKESGISFTVDFKDNLGKEYYKIDWVGTYKYRANHRDNNTYCWDTEYPTFEINLYDDQFTNNSQITDQKVAFLSKGFRFRDGYSFKAELKSLTPEAYTFWRLVKDQTENDGSIFSSLPATIKSNMHNEQNPDDIVLGYFFTSAVASSRVFVPSVTYSDITSELPGCQPFRPWDPIKEWCYDCTLYQNSTNVEPSFWMN